MSFNFSRWSAAAAVALLVSPGPISGQEEDGAGVARRVAAITAVAADEYALGVANGAVVSEAELTEARLFFDEARRLATGLPEAMRADAVRILDSLRARAGRLDAPAALRGDVESLRRALASGLGIQLDPLPRTVPSLAVGERLYRANCAACHGARGVGDGRAGASLDPPPADLTDRNTLASSSPLDFFRKISVGVAGTAMTGFESKLTLDERWALAVYTSGLRFSEAERRTGAAWVSGRCRGCDVWLSDLGTVLDMSDDSLMATMGSVASERPPAEAVAYARTAPAAEVLGADRGLATRRVASRVSAMIDQVVALAAAGEPARASEEALAAYLAFEEIETEVGARSAAAAAEVERSFAQLRAAARSGGDVPARAAAARAAVERAGGVATEGGGAGVLFGQSLLIIVREGLEAILIVGALMAFLVKAGARGRMREIGLGAGLAVVASVVTAGALATVFRVTAAQQEAIEGITMLLASVVLFSVASWMVSKIEAEKWRAFVTARVRDALSSGRAFALAGVAFLAVYREGVETVLFYGALLGTADGAAGVGGVVAGLALGLALLAVVYLAIQRWGLRIPLRPFFAVTGMLLTVMAVSFAGQGVAELQAAGWVPSTPLGLPAVPALGLFPTVQTFLAQVTVAAAFLAALGWIFWMSPRPAPYSIRR